MRAGEAQALLGLGVNIDLRALCVEAHENALVKGFWAENENVPQRIALIHDEIDEAYEDCLYYGVDLPDSFDEELADVVIRIADLSGFLNLTLDQWTVFGKGTSIPWIPYAAPMLQRAHLHVSRALRVHRKDGPPREMALHLSQCVRVLHLHCEARGVDLFAVVREKMEKNVSRPYLHGKRY